MFNVIVYDQVLSVSFMIMLSIKVKFKVKYYALVLRLISTLKFMTCLKCKIWG
jgi:hypothetical protein